MYLKYLGLKSVLKTATTNKPTYKIKKKSTNMKAKVKKNNKHLSQSSNFISKYQIVIGLIMELKIVCFKKNL